MRIALEDLKLDHLWVIYPGQDAYKVYDRITVWPIVDIADLFSRIK